MVCPFSTPIHSHRVVEGFTDPTVTMLARYAWKYAASRSMTGTPQFIVNGVHVPDAPGYDTNQWQQFIDGLLSTPAWPGAMQRDRL